MSASSPSEEAPRSKPGVSFATTSDLINAGIERESLALCAFSDAAAGRTTTAAAVAEVLKLTDEERDQELTAFLTSTANGMAATQSFDEFVAFVNAFAAQRVPKPVQINSVLLHSTIKWHIQLQRVRRRTFITPMHEPDDICSFAGAVADGHSSLSRFHRKGSTSSTESDSGSIHHRPPFRRHSSSTSFSTRLTEGDLMETASKSALSASRVEEDADEAKQQQQHEAEQKANLGAAASPKRHRSSAGALMVRSREMGMESEDDWTPLATSAVGSFSCHGLDDNLEKINQDCACVAFPCNGDEDAALFIVLDGHGELGDVVSNELLQQMYDRLSGSSAAQSAAAALTAAALTAPRHIISNAHTSLGSRPIARIPCAADAGGPHCPHYLIR